MDRTFMKIVHIFSLFVTGYSQTTCRPPGPDGIPYCCPFYFLKQNVCVECPAGYKKSHSGYNCSVPCRHPSYGARCGGRCNCSEEDCHHVYGCHLTNNRCSAFVYRNDQEFCPLTISRSQGKTCSSETFLCNSYRKTSDNFYAKIPIRIASALCQLQRK